MFIEEIPIQFEKVANDNFLKTKARSNTSKSSTAFLKKVKTDTDIA